MTEEERIKNRRASFLLEHPFLGCLSLMLVIKESPQIPTMATDGRRLLYNKKFVRAIGNNDLEGVIAHEIGHILLRHAGEEGRKRAEGKIEEIWQIACEFAVNHFVKDLFRLSLPGRPYYNKRYADGRWTTEDIYFDLLKKGVPEGEIIDAHSLWGSINGEFDKEWRIWIAQALHSTKLRGNLPAGLERLIEDVLDPKLPWRHVLAEFLIGSAKDNYTFRRLNKRHLWRGVFAPALYSETLNIGFAMDTSGSMSEEELSEGVAELKSICNVFPSYNLHLFGCDADLHFYEEVTPSDEIDIKGLVRGGGGTDFRPVFQKIADDNIVIDAIVYFTDAMGTFPKESPEYPVLWVVKGNEDVPWGRRINYE